MTYQEYTSSFGGNHFFPAAVSLSRNFFNSRNSLHVMSSFKCASQLSSSVSISSLRSSLCSGVRSATHFRLSNLAVVAEASTGFGFGAPKNDAMLPSALGIFVFVCASRELLLRLSVDIARGGTRTARDVTRRKPSPLPEGAALKKAKGEIVKATEILIERLGRYVGRHGKMLVETKMTLADGRRKGVQNNASHPQ